MTHSRSIFKQAILTGLILAAGLFLSIIPAQGEEVAIAFTGQATAALYPCFCSGHHEGGVARRGAAIKKLRQEYPRLLVVEAGMSFASGPEDASAQNTPLDMRRTEIYLAALKSMGMDALLVSSQEFVFSADFLDRYKDLPFLSSNVDGVGVPFILKKFGSASVGILGLSDVLARSRGASSWRLPQQVLAESVKALRKKGANLVVVLSALSPQEDGALLKDVGGIDVVINGTSFHEPVDLKKTDGGSRWVQTWWEAGKIGVLVLEVSGRDVKAKKLEAVSLGPEIEDDPDVKALLPACFQDSDCKKLPGLRSRCENGGTPKAECLYVDLPAVPVTVIVPKACKTCRVDEVMSDLDKLLGKVKLSTLFDDTPQAQALIKSLRLKMLPAYIVDVAVEKHDSFPYISKIFDKEGAFYVLKPQVAGVSYFIDRKPVLKRLDVFFDFTYPALGALCDRLLEFQALYPDVDVRFHFLAAWDEASGFKLRPGSAAGDVDEFKRAACVNKYYPGLFLRYVECRSVKKDPVLWQMCANETGMDASKIKDCAGCAEGEALFKERIQLTKELEVATGPIFVIDNKEVFGIAGVPSVEELEKGVLGVRKDKNEVHKARVL